MSIGSGLAIYFVLWWIVLFAVLPFGVRSQHEDGESEAGTDPGAPIAARMLPKLIWTTVVSGVLFTAGVYAYQAGYLNIDRLSKLMGIPL